MRVGIDYRFLAVGPGLITRGICRYTQQQVREVVGLAPDDEFVLLCNHGADLALIDPAVRSPDNVEIALYMPPRDPWGPHSRAEDLLDRGERYQQWVLDQDIDVYHSASPFLQEEPRLLRFDACPTVATFYDVIPMLFPEHYPIDHRAGEYARSMALIRQADRLMAISDAARDDAVRYLGIERDRIDRAWPIPDECFRPMSTRTLEKLLVVVGSRVRLPERYVLTVSALHHAKNLATLLGGYSLLPRALRSSMPLVVCCFLDVAGEREVRRLAAEVGIEDDIVVTGHVSDEELSALYNQATMLVHPSRYEGFGLPVVEAMRCGAPVVTTTASSLPEVAGAAALLVDPEDPAAFTDAIARVAGDPLLRQEMRERGFHQAKQFHAAQLGEATLDSYRRTLARPVPDRAGRLRLALWTPLPPLRSGIADYSAELLEGLGSACDVEVFVDGGYLPDAELLHHHPVQHHSAFARRQAAGPFDAVVYQIGGSMFHDYMSAALARWPGIVVLHDLVWSSVIHARYCRQGKVEGFHDLLTELYGRRATNEFRAIEPLGNDVIWDFLVAHPMLDPLLDGSLAQAVLLPAAARELRACYPGTDPWIVPMGVADPYAGNPGLSRETARCQLGIDPDAFVIGTFGIVHPLKRLENCVRALAQITDAHPGAQLLIVGRALEESYSETLRELAQDLGIASQVTLKGHLPKHVFDDHLVASDVVVSLRPPTTHKHMSAAVLRAIAAGRPLVLSDLADWHFLPDSFCRWVPGGPGELAALARELGQLAGDRDERASMARAAREWYEQEGTVERMAASYVELVEWVRAAASRERQPVGSAP